MSISDVILIVLLIILVGIVIYFSFIKNRGNKCYGCPYAKSCNKDKCEKR